jgi:hypothetical protein
MKCFAILLIFLIVFLTFPFNQPVAKAQSESGWINRYTYQTNLGNGSYQTTSYIGSQVFWNSATQEWVPLLLENHTSNNPPYYLIRNGLIAAKVGLYKGEDAVLYYHPDDITKEICAELWNVQAYIASQWQTLTTEFYTHKANVTENFINITGIFRAYYGATWLGWLQISYILKPAEYLKHEVAFRNIYSGTIQFRAVMTLLGIAGKKVILPDREIIVTLNETEATAWFLRFVNATDPKHQFLHEKLDSLGHWQDETWFNDYLKAVRLKLVDYKGKNLVRCDIVIGNYTLSRNQEFYIDPDSATWNIGAIVDDAREKGTGVFTTSTYNNVYSNTDPLVDGYRCAGLMWKSVEIPQGSTIDAAVIESWAYSSSTDDPNCKIYGDDVDDSLDFEDNPHIISEVYRPRTTDYADYVTTGIPYGQYNNSTDVSDPVQEIVSRAGWEADNNLTLLIIANTDSVKQWTFESYENGGHEAILHVTWTEGAGETTVNLWGTALLSFSVNKLKTFSFTRYGSATATFSIILLKEFAWNLAGTASLTYGIIGSFYSTTETLLNLFGTAILTYAIQHQRSWTWNLYGTSQITFTPTGTFSYIVGVLLNLYGTASLTFNILQQRSFTFNLYGTTTLNYAVQGLINIYVPGLIQLYGTAALTFLINATSTGLFLPISTSLILGVFSIAIGIICLGFIFNHKHRQADIER